MYYMHNLNIRAARTLQAHRVFGSSEQSVAYL